MSRSQFALMLVLAGIFAFLGGLVGQVVTHGPAAYAQPEDPEDPVNPLKATAFILVDAKGMTRASLTMKGNEPMLMMSGARRGCKLTLGTSAMGPSVKLLSPGRKALVLGRQGLKQLDSSGLGE